MKRLPVPVQLVAVRNRVNAIAHDVVFGDDFADVEAIVDSLRSMSAWAAVEKFFIDSGVAMRPKRIDQFAYE